MYRPVSTFSAEELNALYIEIENELRTGKNFVEIAKILEQKYGIVFAEAEYMIQQVKLKSFGNTVIKPPQSKSGLRFIKAFGGLALIVVGIGFFYFYSAGWNLGCGSTPFGFMAIIAGIAVIWEQIFEH